MKKSLLFLLVWCMSLLTLNATDQTFNRTYTVGKTYTIDPAKDLGLAHSNDRNYISRQNGGTGHTSELYYVSDVSAFSIEPVFAGRVREQAWDHDYYTFQVTALKTGFYTFHQEISHYLTPYSTIYNITYNITVVDVTSISMASSMNMFVGEEKSLTPIISHVNAETTLIWNSSNPSVATVSSDGLITGINSGTTTITCTAHNGVSAQCEVTVNPVQVSGITLNESEAEMVVGEKLSLTATIAPDNATDKSVTWSSTNEAVAVVSESGQVTAVGSGTCQIKATANDGSELTASCLVTVEKNNKLAVTDMTQCNGGRGVLNVLLSDEETILGFQFDLKLPEGVTVPTNENGNLMASLTGNAVNTHSISSSMVSEGLYRFVITSQTGRAISNDNGDGMTITIDVADDVAVGVYEITIKDIEMTVKKSGGVYEDVHPRDNTALLTITDAVIGDVTGDTRITVTDVITLISYIQEEAPARFIQKAADVNGDGKITITDAVQMIDIILGKR